MHWPLTLVISLALAVPLVLLLRRRRAAAAAAAKRKAVLQKDRVEISPRVPGKGSAALHGVRVVEIANTIAVPMAGRILAELGAEVVKVEPIDGDPWRQWLLNYESPRTQGSSFESANLNKSSVTADFTTTDGVKKLRDLLRDADVLITNTRPESLKRLGLTQDELLRDFPHLVYASLSAWGHLGPEAQNPGYDLGAFWASTGLATTVQTPEGANQYPTGFGDVLTSCAIVGAISVALRRRLVSGKGGAIQTALVRTAAFALAPLLLVDTASEEKKRTEREQLVRDQQSGPILNGVDCGIGRAKPDYDDRWLPPTLNNAYPTKGTGTAVAIAVDVQDAAAVAAATGALRAALSLDEVTSETLQRALAGLEHEHVLTRLATHHVPHIEVARLADLILLSKAREQPLYVAAEGFTPPLADVPDIPGWVRVPFQLHCSSDHQPRYGAPQLGAHNDSVARKPWSDRHAKAELPRGTASDAALAAKLARAPLADVVVVELSATALGAGAGVMFADSGAVVHLVEDRSLLAKSLRTREPLLFRNLARGKRSVAVDSLAAAGGVDVVHRLLATANVFLCDWPIHELAALGLDPKTLTSKYPRLVVANATAYGLDGDAALPNNELAFWAPSGLASSLSGVPISRVSMPPPHFGELVTAIQLFAGAACALFHQLRTGEGQRTDVNLVRAGLWGQCCVGLVTVPRDPNKLALFSKDPATRRATFLVPTAHCLRTRDGVWVQLLGAELARHFWRTVKALRVPKAAFVSKLAWIVLTKVLTSKSKNPIVRVMPVLVEINRQFMASFAQLTYAELAAEFKQHDVWHTVIRQPRNFRAYEQAHVNGAFQLGAADGAFVTSTPFDIDGLTPATAAAPALGASSL